MLVFIFFLYIFFPLAACLLSSLLPGPPEHHQLPYSETPCPGENTPALLGTPRYRDLPSQSQRRLRTGSQGMEAECSCLGCREGAERKSPGPPPRPGPRALRCCEPGRTQAAVWTALAAGAPPLTPFFAWKQLNFQVERLHLQSLQAATGGDSGQINTEASGSRVI